MTRQFDPTIEIEIAPTYTPPPRRVPPPKPDHRARQLLGAATFVAALAAIVVVSSLILSPAPAPELVAPTAGSTTVTEPGGRAVDELPRVAGLKGLHDGPDGEAGNVLGASSPSTQGGIAAVAIAARPAPSSTAPVATTSPASGCDPNYSGCVPIASDVDCAGGGGNGPAYIDFAVRVIGRDVYDLDRNNDGIGCDKFGGPRETVPPVTTTPTTEPEPEPEPTVPTVPTTVETVPTTPPPTEPTTVTAPTTTEPTITTVPTTTTAPPSTPPPPRRTTLLPTPAP